MQPTIDVPSWIDQQGIGRLQIRVLALCALLVALDGFDALAIAYTAPQLMRDLNVTPAEFTPVFVFGLLGLMGGMLLLGPLADLVGRKRIIIASTLVFGTASLLTATADSLTTLSLWRFITGIGLGGLIPNVLALTTEFFPRRRRATAAMVMWCGFPCGGALAGVAAADLITRFGWQSIFIVGGVAPLIAVMVCAWMLPESLQYLVLKNKSPKLVATALQRINPRASFPEGASFTTQEENKAGLTVSHLFREGRAVGTLSLWVIFIMGLFSTFLLNSWLPTILIRNGFSHTVAATATAALQVGGISAALSTGWLVDRYGPYVIMVPLYLLGGAAILTFGLAGNSNTFIIIAAFLAGTGVIGAQTIASALAAVYYPTYIRATGVGWAFGCGRVGSITGPIAGGMMLGATGDTTSIYWVAAAPYVVIVVAALVMGTNERKKQRKVAYSDAPAVAVARDNASA